MCWSCGCLEPDNAHDDSRALTTLALRGAADQAGIDVAQVIKNIKATAKQFSAVTKADSSSDLAVCRVIKAAEERRYTLGVAYPALKPDVGKAADGYRDFVSAEVLEQTAWNWMRKHRDIGLFHRDGTDGHATVVESYIWRGPDWTQLSPVDGKPYVVKSGDWMLGTIWDDYGWQLVKSGLVQGWSPEGGAARSTPTAERLQELRIA